MFMNTAMMSIWCELLISRIAVFTDRSTKLRLERARQRHRQSAPIADSSDCQAETARSTKLRLEQARQRRGKNSAIVQDFGYDNSLRHEIDLLFSLQRIEHAHVIGWRHWMEGKESPCQKLSQENLNNLGLNRIETRYWSAMEGKQGCYAESNFHSQFKGLTASIEQEFLERACKRLQETNKLDYDFDNALGGTSDIMLSSRRVRHADAVAWHYWSQDKENFGQKYSGQTNSRQKKSGQKNSSENKKLSKQKALLTKAWALSQPESDPEYQSDTKRLSLGIDILSTFLPGSQKERVVKDFVLRDRVQVPSL